MADNVTFGGMRFTIFKKKIVYTSVKEIHLVSITIHITQLFKYVSYI